MAKILTADEAGGAPDAGIHRVRQPRVNPKDLTVDFTELANAGVALIEALDEDFQGEADNAFISDGVAKYGIQSQRDFQKAKNETDENATDFTKNLNQQLLSDVPDFLTELQKTHRPSREAISDLANRIHGYIGSIGVDSTKFEFKARREREASTLDNSIKSIEINAFNNPGNFKSNLADVRDILDRASISKTLPPGHMARFDNAEERLALATINGLILKNPQLAKAQLEAGDFDPFLTDENKAKALNTASSKIEDEETRLERGRKKEEAIQKDKDVAKILLEIDSAVRGKNFNPDKLIEGVKKNKTLSETQKARQIIFINSERDRIAQKLNDDQERQDQANRIIIRSDMDDLADRGALTMEIIAEAIKKPPDENPYAGAGGAEAWERHRKLVRDIRPKWFQLEKNSKTVVDNRGLVKKVFDRDLGVQDLDSIRQAAILAGAPEEQLELLNELAGVVLNQQGGITGQRDNQVYVGLHDRIRDAKIKFGSGFVNNGKIDSVDATVTDLIILQRDIIKAERLGQISKDESQAFLIKVMSGLEKQVEAETGLPVWGLGGGPEDIYDGGYEQIVQLLKENDQEDDVATKAALMRTFVFLAEEGGLDEMEPGSKKEAALEGLGRSISAAYAKTISPALNTLSPGSLPNAIFIRGKVFNVFSGVSSNTPSKRLGGSIRTVKQGNTIFQFIEGTNPPIVISQRKVK